MVFNPFLEEISEHHLCFFNGARSVGDVANAVQLVPPLFDQLWLWQAIHDHGRFVVEGVSYTEFVQKEKDPFNLCRFLIWKGFKIGIVCQ